MGASGNPANRAAARAQGRGAANRVLGQIVVIDDPGDKPSDAIAVAIITGLGKLIAKGGAPLEHSAITIGTDHPEHPGKIVVEVKTDRHARRVELGKPLTLGGE